MWEMEGVPVESFSTRSQELLEAAGPDASLKSRDVAALDTRKSKEAIDPAKYGGVDEHAEGDRV